jgi:nucleoside-diphosphate-sugar epimerase
MRSVGISGGTGYIGRRLVPALAARGHQVRVLARPQSLARVPAGATAVSGDALDPTSVAAALQPDDTLVHLVGTPHPSPSKAAEFQAVDLPAARASIAAAADKGIAHLVYVSVAHPAPVMEAYIASRVAAEATIADAGLTATILRPWYVLGPGHRWPMMLIPVYGILRLIPATRAGAERLGLVTINQMIASLVRAVENPPPAGTRRIVGVPEIKASSGP